MRRFALVALLALAACDGSESVPVPVPVPVPDPAPAPAPTPRVYFVEPTDGATVTSPVKVVMGVEGMEVGKAGEVIAGIGHHHIIVDGPAVPTGTVVPSDATHIHFGGGQTETTVELAPGPHTLRLQFADGMHISFGEAMGSEVHVTVAAP